MKKTSKIRLVLILLTGVLLVSSCVSQRKVRLIQEKVSKETRTIFENPRSSGYRIQTGDHLYIRVYSVDPKTSKFFQADLPYLMNSTYQYLNTYVVDEFGYVSFSFIEKLYVKGLSVPEVQQAIQTQLDEYFKEATAYVKLVNFQVGVLGEVQKPGNFTIEQDQITIFQAIGLAEGVTDYGNFENVKLVRRITSYNVCYTKLLRGYDIFYSKRNGQKWNIPVNLGYPLNDTRNNLGYAPDFTNCRKAFYSLTVDGDEDLYLIEITSESTLNFEAQ